MKKITVITIVILALLFTMLPASTAFAKASSAVISVRNQTGASVDLVIQNASISRQFSFATGAVEISLPASTYRYVAKTACGLKVGTINLSRSAVLHFSCVPSTQVRVRAHG